MQHEHLLRELVFPDRYEQLVRHLGEQVVRILVPPASATTDALEEAAYSVKYSDSGLLCPLYAPSGTGKTTLASNVSTFHRELFGSTLTYDGALTTAALRAAVNDHNRDNNPANDERVIPVNIDSREAAPADAREMADIKRFLRDDIGRRVMMFWPTTDENIAKSMAGAYSAIAGTAPIELPLTVEGPARSTWVEIARNTVTLANNVDSIELLANPADYDPAEYTSIGEFLRAVARDFLRRRMDLLRSTKKPLQLTVLFASESSEPGVLSQLTSSARFGLLDASALVHVTSNSELGRWWSQRRGLLTQAIVQLDAHAFVIPPALFVPILRMHGQEDLIKDLIALGTSRKSPAELQDISSRSDIGRHLLGERRSSYETRGNPGENSRIAFGLLVESGYIRNGRDKQLNKSLAVGLHSSLETVREKFDVKAEKKIEFAPIIPDVSFENERLVHCVEFAWRAGDFLRPANRSDAATYILNKLRNYARSMEWTTD
ncbi:hypothetical protein [Actinokineospora pegani]|uniref:hypothetical protein n=1 Tax=Actinokineospora pegani TaxID=2654637 RepID=UPI0012EAF245|nr:hypothetical protein [Actinokineospora pegani]